MIPKKQELPPIDAKGDGQEHVKPSTIRFEREDTLQLKAADSLPRSIHQRAKSESHIKPKELLDSNGDNAEEVENKGDPEQWKKITLSVKEVFSYKMGD